MRLTVFFILLVSAIFVIFPSLDLAFTGLFYNEEQGFYLADNVFFRLLYKSVPIVTTITIAVSVYSLVISLLQNKFKGKKLPFLPRKMSLILLVALAIGPGLLVNATFKDQWGRARPKNIEMFGGEKQFTPAWIFSNQGGKSFTSGHASVAFFTTILVLFASKYRGLILAVTLTYGSLVGLARIVQGGHYLSDTLLAALMVCLVNMIVFKLFTEGWWFKKPRPA